MKKSDILKDFKEYLESLHDEEFFEVFEKEFGAVFKEVPQVDGIAKVISSEYKEYQKEQEQKLNEL